MQNSQGEWRRVKGEWRHLRYGWVRMNAAHQWVFQDFTGRDEGPFPTAAEARAALESEWEGWYPTDTGLMYRGFGSLEQNTPGTWVARAPDGSELLTTENPAEAVLALARRSLPILRSGMMGSAVAVLGVTCLAIAPSMAGIDWGVWAVAFALGLALFISPLGMKGRGDAAVYALAHAIGVAAFGCAASGMLRDAGIDWATITWSVDAARALFIAGVVLVGGGRWVARRVEDLATAEPPHTSASN